MVINALTLPTRTERHIISADEYNNLINLVNDLRNAISFTGIILDFGGTTIPAAFAGGWLLCDGSFYLQSQYPDLHSVLGRLHEPNNPPPAYDLNLHFFVPDLRGRSTFGVDREINGSFADRIDLSITNIDDVEVGSSGGASTHTLTRAELAKHTHRRERGSIGGPNPITGDPMDDSTGDDPVADKGQIYGVAPIFNTTHVLGMGVGDQPHNNMPPATIVNKIIKT